MNATQIRALILGILAVVNLFVPLPESAREAIADHATTIIGAVLALWAVFAGLRARAQQQGREP